MPGITEALGSASNYIGALEKSLTIIQGNVGNASTPGYARQDVEVAGGASSSVVIDQQTSRDEFTEAAVRQQNSLLGHFTQLASTLTTVESNFSAAGDTGIPKSVNDLFSAFSALSTNPNDTTARQEVINQARQLAQSFNTAASNLTQIQSAGRQQISSQGDSINHLAGLVQVYNTQHTNNPNGVVDPIVDAKLHAALEQLSGFASVQALPQTDGSITLLLGGQTPLVVGNNQYKIVADVTSGPLAAIRDSNGQDITAQVSGGSLSGALQALNQTIPGYQNSLNQLAQGLADSVNTTLAAGVDASGNSGAPLFTYNSPADAASSLAVAGITAAQVAAATPAAPGGNGNALALSALGSSLSLNGFTFAGFYANIAATVGQDVANAKDSQTVQTQLLSQARAQRNDVSGVSLDEEAVRLVDFQRAYEAAAKVVTVLDQLSQDTINMIPPQ